MPHPAKYLAICVWLGVLAHTSDAAARAPRRFDFEPTQFSGLFGPASPVLNISPGDMVRTWTLDAEGFDSHGVRKVTLANPQTGPFYVETAMPGDTLVIHFHRIRTNRATADMYGDILAANALEPYSIRREAPVVKGSGTWNLDPERGVARLARPSQKLTHFEVPLQPMLGCVGVAPAYGQSFRTVNLGAYGGNLDYSGVHEGATVYLPVFQPGALLFIGDGHARQGDGELTGTGLETSMDVEFTVDVIKGQSLGQPRIEDAEFVMISGIGGSLSDALQLATSGMVRWLKETYGLSSGDIAMVLGSSMRYDITEIVDPQIHVVAKLRKDLLSNIAAAGPAPGAPANIAN
ncbi:MAG TPA: acetamidase/formamidase family protein [Steroidobacteraceae bacterium]|nr:acetamidase/formamidase family protein [Steroidobacteraceae bacterium]